MALVKQPIPINFAKGLDTKTDPYQVPLGNFLRLENSVFDISQQLTKRNGYGRLSLLPEDANFLTTFDGNLTAIGSSLLAYAKGPNTWINKGDLHPVSMSVLSLIRSNSSQVQVDAVRSSSNLVCTVYTETGTGSTLYKYAVADSVTGQNILAPAVIPSVGSITVSPKVFLLGSYFIIVYGTSTSIRYVAINTANPQAPTAAVTLSAQFQGDTRQNFDGVVANGNLYIAWNGSDLGDAVRITYIDVTLTQHNIKVYAGKNANLMSVSADQTTPTSNIWVSFWDAGTSDAYTLVLTHDLQEILAPTLILDNTSISNLTSTIQDTTQTVYYEVPNNYAYDSSIASHYVSTVTCDIDGTVGTPAVLVRSVGLASRAFQIDTTTYFLGVYSSENQSTYFLIDESAQVLAKLAYSNAGGYHTKGLSNVTIENNLISIPYQYKDLLVPVNKEQGVDTTSSVFAQTGLNYVTFELGSIPVTCEIGSSLCLTGGFLWNYDGYSPVENNFFVWPDNVEVTTSGTGGLITAQEYFYQALYEWTDNQGNIQRSAPSIPVSITTTGATSTNSIHIPTLRLTYKLANPVKIVLYRWSEGQQAYYQVTSVTSPTYNNPAVDYVTITDTLADSSILGNSLIYTTGGVIENIGAPSFSAVTLFDSRMWGIDSEDPNLLWYSKQVIENTPVEMSDLFTIYAAPTISAQGSTGPTKCIAPMDDKLILFKRDAMYYISGAGPDNTGANSQYSQPTFISSTVGCENQQSIVFTPQGLMFQSDKGIWLLGRGLDTQYIGAPVESYTNNATVQSAVSVPGTNQIRFTLDTGITLMYDYFFGQWGTFTNVPAISSTLYENLHTYINSAGQVFQETPGAYLDGSSPVLQRFTTSWIATAGLQGFQRAYFIYLLGRYISPHKLNIGVAYDYNPSPSQYTVISPDNYSAPWGTDSPWGGTAVWGGATDVEQNRVFFEKGKCQAIQIQVDEIFDPSFGTSAGEGLTLSGMNLVIGTKKPYPTISAARSFGG